jgi:hypothetical protein
MHFTQLANLPSIVSHGLVSRVDLQNGDIDGYASAACRIDGCDAAISVSVSAFNWKMFAAKRKAASRRASWVILLLEPSILWTHRCRFYARNAALNEMKWHRGRLDGPWAFNRMYSNDFAPARHNGADYRSDTGIPSCLTTCPDAEVQVFDRISPEMIIHAWTDTMPVARVVQDQLNRLSGFERDVTVRPFEPRFQNSYFAWG